MKETSLVKGKITSKITSILTLLGFYWEEELGSQRVEHDLATEHQQQWGIDFSPTFSLLENNATTECLSLQSSQFQILP